MRSAEKAAEEPGRLQARMHKRIRRRDSAIERAARCSETAVVCSGETGESGEAPCQNRHQPHPPIVSLPPPRTPSRPPGTSTFTSSSSHFSHQGAAEGESMLRCCLATSNSSGPTMRYSTRCRLHLRASPSRGRKRASGRSAARRHDHAVEALSQEADAARDRAQLPLPSMYSAFSERSPCAAASDTAGSPAVAAPARDDPVPAPTACTFGVMNLEPRGAGGR